jgi:biotin carboxyl carrier protein
MATKVALDTAGSVWKVLVSPGDKVKAGDMLFIMEIMKMEVPHEAPCAGTIKAVHIEEGDQGLEEGTLAMEID